MKIKTMILSAMCAMAVALPMQAQQSATSKVQSAVASKMTAFSQMQTVLTNGATTLKTATTADQVCKVAYDYTYNMIKTSKSQQNFSDYQKKQIDVLTKQFSTQLQAKIAKLNCKKQVDAAISRATMDALK